jgi:hypothetical protein
MGAQAFCSVGDASLAPVATAQVELRHAVSMALARAGKALVFLDRAGRSANNWPYAYLIQRDNLPIDDDTH